MRKNDFQGRSNQMLTMDRKATIKKYGDMFTFTIYENQNIAEKIQISPNSTVDQLVSQLKIRLGPSAKGLICLTSRDSNEIIDYTLKMKNFPLSNYPNNMSFQILRKMDVQNQHEPSLQDFQFIKLLGSGISASVYLVRHRSNGVLYALKQINKSYFKDFKRMEQVLRERKIMIDVLPDIPFTTKLIASFESQKYLNLVLQYCPGGQMFVHLQRRRLTEDQAKLYVAQMTLALEKLHQKKIIYRDLKPQNIMIDFDGHARLGDFGLCKWNLEYYDLTYSYCGSQQYMAPEVRTEHGYNYSVDFYTLGSFAYQLVNGVPPYYNNQPLYFHENLTDEFAELVTRLIQANMHKRLKSFTEIKKLKWFKNIEWRKIVDKKYQMPFKLSISQNYIGEQFKNQIIDPQIYDQAKFDKLLQCFFYLSPDKNGISQFYGTHSKKKQSSKKSIDSHSSSSKKKRLSFQSSHNENSHRNNQSSKTSQRSSKSKSMKSNSKDSKDKNTFRRKVGPNVNIYTSENLADKSGKKLFSSNRSQSNNKNVSKGKSGDVKSKSNFSSTNNLKKSQKDEQQIKKIKMNKVKSNSNLLSNGINNSNTYKRVTQLQNLFSPTKMKSPKKMRPGAN